MGHSIKYSVSTSRVWQDTQSYIRPQPVKVTRRQQLEEGWAGRRRLGQMLWPRRFGRPSPCSRCTWTPSSAWKGGWSWSWLPNSTDFFIGFLFRCCQLMPDQISDWSARWRPGRWWPRPWWLSDICYSPKKSGNLFWKHEKVTYLSWSHQQSKVPALGWKQELISKFFPNCRWTTAREVQPRLFRFSSAWSAASVCEPSLCFQSFLLYWHCRAVLSALQRSNHIHLYHWAFKTILWGSETDQGRARYSQVQSGTARYRWYPRCYIHLCCRLLKNIFMDFYVNSSYILLSSRFV